MAQAVTVAVRVRPFNDREKAEGAQNIIQMSGGTKTTIVGDQGKSHTFSFDHSFWSHDVNGDRHDSQEDVYQALGSKILSSAIDGYNTCLFAYGQTGSGKTYTMLGYGEDTGVIPRLCKSLFETCDKKRDDEAGDWDCRVQVSYLEIYNEKCRCLLNPNSKEVKPREHPATGPYVEGLTTVIVSTFEEIEQLMDEGNKTRTVASTAMNATSSRSHAIFTITFTQFSNRNADPDGKGSEKVSKINLVDLAGSERANKTGATGATLKEGANINKSLVCLGKVIAALADHKKGAHIPFRDSSLTWLLKENLGGNSRTIMMAALSPHVTNYEESLSTLRYADRAKRIKTHAVVNEDPTSKRIRELTEEVDRLKQLLTNTNIQPTQSKTQSTEEEEENEYTSLSAAEQLALTVAALEDAAMPWEDKQKKNEEIQEERHQALIELGIGVEVDKNNPSLINLNEDPFMNECLVYFLKSGETTIGSSPTCDITIQGDLQSHHCTITTSTDEIKLQSTSSDANTCVNGLEVTFDKPLQLQPRDRIIFGDRHVFRLNHPLVEQKQRDEGSINNNRFDYQMAINEKYETFKRNVMQEVQREERRREEEVQQQIDDLKKEERRREEEVEQQQLSRIEAELRVKELEENLKQTNEISLPMQNLTGTAPTVPTPNKLAPAGIAAQQKGALHTSTGGRIKYVDVGLFSANRKHVSRVPPQLLRKYKVILIGHEEVGKTSIKKCWQSGDPRFFKKLPDVMCTTGIEVQEHRLKYEGHGAGKPSDDDLTLSVLDFAGQEVYHSHSLFLSPRSMFVFVWNMSNYEDGQMAESEESRMMSWLDEVYSKAPGSSAVLLGTHKDELPSQKISNLNAILNNVKARVEEYVQSIRIADEPEKDIRVVGSYACSCKSRGAWGGEFQSEKGAKMSELLRAIGGQAFKNCLADKQYPSGAIPGRHIQFLRELERLKSERKKLLLPIQEYAQLASDFGIEDQGELRDCTNLFHSWNVIYLFTQAKRLLDHPYIFLHPLWLSHMVSALFSMAHLLYTPPAARKYIGGLNYNPEEALRVDMGRLRNGELTLSLARVLLSRSIKDIRNDKQDAMVEDVDLEMCLQLLISMDLVYQRVLPSESDDSDEETSQYYVPSLFPLNHPPSLKAVVPYLFQKGLFRMYMFNIFPKEFYYRLVCRLQHLMIPISVPVPEGITIDIGEDVKYLPPNYDHQVRNHWKDGMWIGTQGIRAFVYQIDTMIYAVFSPSGMGQTGEVSQQEFIDYFDEVINTLADEYDGLSMSCCQPCVNGECENWFEVKILNEVSKKDGSIQCQNCQEDKPAKTILRGGGLERSPGPEWNDLWPNLTAALGTDKAAALLCSLECIINESDISDAGESYLSKEDSECDVWADKFISVLMYIAFCQQQSYS